jgi:hypothetical protein
MKPGDTITDTLGQTWTLDTSLGRGVWGRTWGVRGPAGTQAVLKTPLVQADFGDATEAPEHARRAAALFRATADLLAARPTPCLPRLIATLADRPGLLIPRLGGDLESRLQGSAHLSEVIDLCVRALHQLAHASADAFVHGNLRPSNVLVDDQGGLVLTDPRPLGHDDDWARLAAVVPGRVDYGPPGASGSAGGAAASPSARAGADPWAICQILYRAAMSPSTSDDPRRGTHIPLPRTGLTRVALATLKDGAAARLKAEGANRRFAARVVERLGAVLNRGLSAETDPSPPYRFRRAADLLPRLIEVHDLIHPAVETVSKPLLAHNAREGVFDAGQDVELAINVGTTAGVTAQDDLAVGVQLRDLDAPGEGRVRVPNARFTVKQYPSGRWRFSFALPDIVPGRYQVRIAFMVKGAEEHAQVSEGGFQVRPTPGYVPPPSPTDDLPAPLTLPPRRETVAADDAPAAVIAFPQRHAGGATAGLHAAPLDAGPMGFGGSASFGPPVPVRPPEPDDRPILAAVSAVTDDDDGGLHTGPPTYPPLEAAASPLVASAAAHGAPLTPVWTPPTWPERREEPPAAPTPVITLPPAPPPPAPPRPAVSVPVEDGLQDYPSGIAGGIDLPTYDDPDLAPSGPRVWLDKLLGLFGGDGLTATVFLSSGTFIALVVLVFLLRQC